jgi:hypothetical protein
MYELCTVFTYIVKVYGWNRIRYFEVADLECYDCWVEFLEILLVGQQCYICIISYYFEYVEIYEINVLTCIIYMPPLLDKFEGKK